MWWGKYFTPETAPVNIPCIPCPLCGKDMVWEDVAWFCRNGARRPDGTFDPCWTPGAPLDPEAEVRFYAAPRGKGGWQDGFQFYAEPHGGRPAWHAVAITRKGELLAHCQFVRGHMGRTNLTVHAHVDPQKVVEFFRKGGKWTLAPWFLT